MSALDLSSRLEVLAQLGHYLGEKDERMQAHMSRASVSNPWFTLESMEHAVAAIATEFLDKGKLEKWAAAYGVSDRSAMHNIGIVAAGNIPLVSFHDVLCVFVAGHMSQVKLSERDKYLLPFIVKWMTEAEPLSGQYFEFADKLSGFDAVIATGSNNTAKYFEQYFGKYPHIIRKNRNGLAVLTGEETFEELVAVGRDIFTYFGLGCRNISQILVPANYDFSDLRGALDTFSEVMQHKKYRNNIDYALAMKILNKEPHMQFEGIVLYESDSVVSPVGCLHYRYYGSASEVEEYITSRTDEIQCVVSNLTFSAVRSIAPGRAQAPGLDDYADGVDVMDFLLNAVQA